MNCYVYEHWRPDKNLCFYVGKGTERRAWQMSNRNSHHKSIASKLTSLGLTIDVRIIKEGLNDQDALNLEIERIQFYGRDNLANMTDGGDGLSKPCEETRKKMSEAHKGKILTEEHRKNLSKSLSGKKRKPLSEEHKQKIKFSNIGVKCSEETKKKISSANKGKIHPPFTEETLKKMSISQKTRVRKPWSDEVKNKISSAKKGKPWSENRRMAYEKMRVAI